MPNLYVTLTKTLLFVQAPKEEKATQKSMALSNLPKKKWMLLVPQLPRLFHVSTSWQSQSVGPHIRHTKSSNLQQQTLESLSRHLDGDGSVDDRKTHEMFTYINRKSQKNQSSRYAHIIFGR